MDIFKTIIRIGIGIFFIVSAILKLLGLDHFELYIYSFNLMNLTLSGLAARTIIALEILAGILLIIKVRYKEAWWLTMLMLIGFSLLLIYVMIFRDDSNCHCMGELVEIRPSLSLLKNIVVIVLMLFIRDEKDYVFRGRKVALALAFVAAIVPPFVLFPVDNVYTLFSKSGQQDYDKTSYNALMSDSTMQEVNFDDGNYIVGVVSSGCQYCRTSCLKMSEIVAHNHIDTNRVAYLIWGGSASIRLFPAETESTSFRFYKIQPLQAIRITNGHFPTYLFLHNGEIIKSADLRHLTEKEVKNHLQ